ncbi:PPE family protein [[Mycobacterium] holstebronense]|uniref:PPE family protein n=1 Tax=[Mycobacterium] holstebronense TaxID=3064288 RepID=A0ABM9LXL7_9MYCO|nr:PPE family protein [Mycolicibacter sp. MU0102]CAJ1506446.1 PPE family protein [Mycolicibacter sp. MU0102]
MSFDFGALPPEIVSAWMYSGAGSGPLMSAAAAWGSLAAELEASATSAQLVVSELVGGDWTGPASAAMTSAVSPYLSWLQTTSAAAHQASSQAMASAGAFEAARATVVSPAIIAANRAQLAALVASNFLGVNTPAILATEAHYMEMWAQDTMAMFGYSTASSSAAALTPMTPAPQTTNPVGAAVATAGSATGGLQQELTQSLTSLQGALQSLLAPLTGASEPTLVNAIDVLLGTPLFANAINGGVNTAAWFTATAIPTAVSLGHTLALAGPASLASDVTGMDGLAAGLGSGVLAGMTQPVGAVAAAGTPVLASLGQASTMGGMSVPASWSGAAGTQLAASTGSGWTVAAEETAGMHAVPAGMAPMGAGGRGGLGSGGPRYGFRPTVMPKQVLV